MTSPETDAGRTRVHYDYDGRRFRSTDSDAAPGREPVGHYHQQGDLVWAEFSGAHLRTGRLVGVCRADGSLEAAYCQVTTGGEAIAGTVVSTPTVLPDGRLRLTEQWRRADGSSGVSHIEEVDASGSDR